MHINITSMEQLKKFSIRITDKTEFICPITGRVDKLQPNCFSPAYRKKYAIDIKKNIVSFIDEQNHWYVIPNLKGVEELLGHSYYTRAGFFVPCSDGKYPVKHKKSWYSMLEQAKSA